MSGAMIFLAFLTAPVWLIVALIAADSAYTIADAAQRFTRRGR